MMTPTGTAATTPDSRSPAPPCPVKASNGQLSKAESLILSLPSPASPSLPTAVNAETSRCSWQTPQRFFPFSQWCRPQKFSLDLTPYPVPCSHPDLCQFHVTYALILHQPQAEPSHGLQVPGELAPTLPSFSLDG
jgi:hypothetical protein